MLNIYHRWKLIDLKWCPSRKKETKTTPYFFFFLDYHLVKWQKSRFPNAMHGLILEYFHPQLVCSLKRGYTEAKAMASFGAIAELPEPLIYRVRQVKQMNWKGVGKVPALRSVSHNLSFLDLGSIRIGACLQNCPQATLDRFVSPLWTIIVRIKLKTVHPWLAPLFNRWSITPQGNCKISPSN